MTVIAIVGLPLGLLVFTIAQFAHISKPRPATRAAMTLASGVMGIGMAAVAMSIWVVARDPYGLLMFGLAVTVVLLSASVTVAMAIGDVSSWSMRRKNRAILQPAN